MWFRDRQRHDDEDQRQATPASGVPENTLDNLRQAGETFATAGDEAIQRALSGDSQLFLAATRQSGGQ